MFIKNKLLALFKNKTWLDKQFTATTTYNDLRILIFIEAKKLEKGKVLELETYNLSDSIVKIIATFLVGIEINLKMIVNVHLMVRLVYLSSMK